MARRKKSSPFEEFIYVIALLPWWAGVTLAVMSNMVLHALAAPVTTVTMQPGQLG